MAHNPIPLTQKQDKFLKSLKNKLIEIRNPAKEILDNRCFEFYIEHTKRLGSIPKIKFKPNSCKIKEEIMIECGYVPIEKKDTWQKARNAAASAFDKCWDNLVFRLVKAGRMLAIFNQMFTDDGCEISDLIPIVQKCIEPDKVVENISDLKNSYPVEEKSYLDELA